MGSTGACPPVVSGVVQPPRVRPTALVPAAPASPSAAGPRSPLGARAARRRGTRGGSPASVAQPQEHSARWRSTTVARRERGSRSARHRTTRELAAEAASGEAGAAEPGRAPGPRSPAPPQPRRGRHGAAPRRSEPCRDGEHASATLPGSSGRRPPSRVANRGRDAAADVVSRRGPAPPSEAQARPVGARTSGRGRRQARLGVCGGRAPRLSSPPPRTRWRAPRHRARHRAWPGRALRQ